MAPGVAQEGPGFPPGPNTLSRTSALLEPPWGYLGAPHGSSWGPPSGRSRMAWERPTGFHKGSKTVPRWPKSAPGGFYEGPTTFHEGSTRAQEGFERAAGDAPVAGAESETSQVPPGAHLCRQVAWCRAPVVVTGHLRPSVSARGGHRSGTRPMSSLSRLRRQGAPSRGHVRRRH